MIQWREIVATLKRLNRPDLIHALRVAAMSLDVAKQLLGFDARTDPSDSQIKEAWKRKAMEHHPDRGGDEQMMKQINVARDVLLGKQRPDRTSPDGSGPAPTQRYEKPARTEIIVTWDEALRNAKVPVGIDWKFVTSPSFGGYGDRHQSGFVVYGRDDAYHVFVAVYHERDDDPYSNTHVDRYTMTVKRVPRAQEIATVAPKVIRELWTRFANVKGYGAKVVLLPDNTKFTQRIAYQAGRKISFKDAMSLLGEATPTQWKGKVDVVIELGKEVKYPDGHKLRHAYKAQAVTLVINGKPYELNAKSNEVIHASTLFDFIWGKQYFYEGSKKNITRLQKAKKVLQWLADKLTGEPDELIDALKAAAEKAK